MLDLNTVVPMSTWAVPAEVWIDDGMLCWQAPNAPWSWDTKNKQSWSGEMKGYLEAFARLAEHHDDPDRLAEAVLAYAKQWGPLWLCKDHDLPVFHVPHEVWNFVDDYQPCTPRRAKAKPGDVTHPPARTEAPFETATWAESITLWSKFAQQAAAMVAIGTQLLLGKRTPSENWEPLLDVFDAAWTAEGLSYPSGGEWSRKPLAHQRHVLVQMVERWTRWGDVRVWFDWDEDQQPKVRYGAHNLFGALAIQLVFALGRIDSYVTCANPECRNEFTPGQGQDRSKNLLCPECRASGTKSKLSVREKRGKDRDDSWVPPPRLPDLG